jgi:hypothetical protein
MEFIIQSYPNYTDNNLTDQCSSAVTVDDLNSSFSDEVVSVEELFVDNANPGLTFWDHLTNLLETTSNDECDSTDVNLDQVAGKRKRLDLETKKNVVEQYFMFCSSANENDEQKVSVRAFVRHNNEQAKQLKLESTNVYRWISAYKRGEYLSWETKIKLQTTRKVSCPMKIINHIDSTLNKRDKCHGVYNKVVRSPSIKGEYGVVARRFTPAGTFLGFYKGKVITGIANDTRNHDYTFGINRNTFIDASDYYSCFARYYNCSVLSADQNVCVEILTDWTNPQKAICFIANKDIKKGDEFIISYGPEYWDAVASKLPRCSPFRRVCNILSGKHGVQESIEPLFTLDAPTLAAEFGDDKSVSSDDGDSDYCE